MKREDGFALLTVLWLITALSAVVGLQLAATRLGQQTTINRITLARGRWAAEACLAITQARWRTRGLTDTATIDLGERTTCAWRVEDPGMRINVNSAEAEVLSRLVRDTSLVARLVSARQSRPFAAVEQLPEPVRVWLTVDGPEVVNLNAASERVLMALPGMTAEAVERIVSRRRQARPVGGLDELAGLLSPSSRAALLAAYADLARIAVFSPSRLVVTAQGWVAEQSPRATIEIMVVPLPERLAVVRRRMW